MNGLEIALIILIAIWSIIFLIIAVAFIMLFFTIKKAIGKANNILDKTDEVASKIDLPSKVVITSILAFMAKNSMGGIKELVSSFFKSKKSR